MKKPVLKNYFQNLGGHPWRKTCSLRTTGKFDIHHVMYETVFGTFSTKTFWSGVSNDIKSHKFILNFAKLIWTIRNRENSHISKFKLNNIHRIWTENRYIDTKRIYKISHNICLHSRMLFVLRWMFMRADKKLSSWILQMFSNIFEECLSTQQVVMNSRSVRQSHKWRLQWIVYVFLGWD